MSGAGCDQPDQSRGRPKRRAPETLERIDLPQLTTGHPEAAFHLARYRFAAHLAAGRRTLDAACGVGYGTALLRAAGAPFCVGVDIAESAIRTAREHYASEGVQFVVDDVCRNRREGPFDLIVSFETIEHVVDPERALSSFARLLSPSGLFIVSTPGDEAAAWALGIRDNPYHRHAWYPDEFERLVARHFKVVSKYGQAWRPSCLRPRIRRAISRAWVLLWRGSAGYRDLVGPGPTTSASSPPGWLPHYTILVCEPLP